MMSRFPRAGARQRLMQTCSHSPLQHGRGCTSTYRLHGAFTQTMLFQGGRARITQVRVARNEYSPRKQ
jgi:hypothetical protein